MGSFSGWITEDCCSVSFIIAELEKAGFPAFFYAHGWEVLRKEPGRAVRLCPWMGGMPEGAKDGGVAM